jgi:hypothetical protein
MYATEQRSTAPVTAPTTPQGHELPPLPSAAASGADWTRADWERLADHILLSLRPYASSGHGRITPPGPEGGYGLAVDGLEGFTRSFLLACFRLAGAEGADPHNLAEWYAAGIARGVDPTAPDSWVRLTEHSQAKVEAASLVVGLDLTRPLIWDRLSDTTKAQFIDYISPVVGDRTYPRNNWAWFRIVTETFLRSVGGPWSAEDLAEDLALHDSFVRADGWLSDGEDRNFDHYIGWALHFFPTLWAHMTGAGDLIDPARRAADVARLDRYLADCIHLVGADGAPLIEGRSLTYRVAAAAPFWTGAWAGVPSIAPGRLRRAASGVAAYFLAHGVPDARGLLTLGWWGEWRHRRLIQAYSGTGSPYWAAHGFLGLALPASHPVWTAPTEPLPVEQDDFLRTIAAPGWLVSGTLADGIVRVHNHGTDHAHPGAQVADTPLYARLGYSTATSPLLDDQAWSWPLEQSVTLVDEAGRSTHRAGFTTLALTLVDTAREDSEGPGPRVGLAASRAEAHWLDPDGTDPNHGAGWTGPVRPAAALTVISLVLGPWELRLVHVGEMAPGLDSAGLTLRIGGWPVIDGDGLTSRVQDVPLPATAQPPSSSSVDQGAEPATAVRLDASPLGSPAIVPYLDRPVRSDAWTAALIVLTGGQAPGDTASFDSQTAASTRGATVHNLTIRPTGGTIDATWPDGRRLVVALPAARLGEWQGAANPSGPVPTPSSSDRTARPEPSTGSTSQTSHKENS